MDSLKVPVVITAISDPEFEGLVSGSLYSQGWNVVARIMNVEELRDALARNLGEKTLVIFSPDLPGITTEDISVLTNSEVTFFGFTDQSGLDGGFKNIFTRPKTPDELLLTILENIRFSGVREPLIHESRKCNAKVVVVGGIGHSTGATNIAINLAQECALLGNKVLLIEANFQAPAISFLLDLRKVSEEPLWREISANFSVMELTQENLTGFESRIVNAGDEFDLIIFDIGSVSYLSHELSDRRWISAVKIWTTRCADVFIYTVGNTPMALKRFDEFSQKPSNFSSSAKVHLVLSGSSNKRESIKVIDKQVHKGGSLNWTLPWDPRSCLAAIAERSTLANVGERSSLRKEIQKLALSLIG